MAIHDYPHLGPNLHIVRVNPEDLFPKESEDTPVVLGGSSGAASPDGSGWLVPPEDQREGNPLWSYNPDSLAYAGTGLGSLPKLNPSLGLPDVPDIGLILASSGFGGGFLPDEWGFLLRGLGSGGQPEANPQPTPPPDILEPVPNMPGVADRVVHYILNQEDLRDAGSARVVPFGTEVPDANPYRGERITGLNVSAGAKSDYIVSTGDTPEPGWLGDTPSTIKVEINDDQNGKQGIVLREEYFAKNTIINFTGLAINLGISSHRTEINGGGENDVIFDRLKGYLTDVSGGDGDGDVYAANLQDSTFKTLRISSDVERVCLMLPEGYELKSRNNEGKYALYINGENTGRTIKYDGFIETIDANNEAAMAELQGIIEDKHREIGALRGDLPFKPPEPVRVPFNFDGVIEGLRLHDPAEAAAAEEPAAEEPAEEPVAEEPVAEEPVAEEPADRFPLGRVL